MTRVTDSEHRQNRSSVTSAGQVFDAIDENSEYLHTTGPVHTPTDTLTSSSITALLSSKWRVSCPFVFKEKLCQTRINFWIFVRLPVCIAYVLERQTFNLKVMGLSFHFVGYYCVKWETCQLLAKNGVVLL